MSFPSYLETVKTNLQISLGAYEVIILEKDNEDQPNEDQDQDKNFSLILTSPKLHHNKYQLFTEAFLNEKSLCFFIRTLVTLNNLQLIIENKQTISMAVGFCHKINRELGNFRLAIDPPSGRVYFETKSFLNESSLISLKRHNLKQDCFYTQVIYCSIKKAQKYMDLLLFVAGKLTIYQLANNPHIMSNFPFLSQCLTILERIHKNLIFIPFLNINPYESLTKQSTESDIDSSMLHSWKIPNSEVGETQIDYAKMYSQKVNQAKQNILNYEFQYFSENAENTLKLFHGKNLYQNIDFSVKPFEFGQKAGISDKTMIDIEKRSFASTKRILSFIEIAQIEGASQDEDRAWRILFEGGFGIIDMANIKFVNLSASYKEPDTGHSLLVKQPLVRKRDKTVKKKKIQRQRTVLQKLKYYAHPNIMNFYISFQAGYMDCIFSDYTPNLSLDLYLKKNEFSINFNQKLGLINQAIEGLIFLHEKNIVHLDIKPGNMLISKRLVLMLSDFGEAFLVNENDPVTHNHAYTIPYCAPEVFKVKAELTDKADIYAIGVCLIRIVLGEHFMETFLQRRFVNRLCEQEILNTQILEKYEKSLIYPIIKIIMMVAYRAVDHAVEKRPHLMWMAEILGHCRSFILNLLN